MAALAALSPSTRTRAANELLLLAIAGPVIAGNQFSSAGPAASVWTAPASVPW